MQIKVKVPGDIAMETTRFLIAASFLEARGSAAELGGGVPLSIMGKDSGGTGNEVKSSLCPPHGQGAEYPPSSLKYVLVSQM